MGQRGTVSTVFVIMRIDAQATTELITIHQMHSYSHIDSHYDPSRGSILGVYPHVRSRMLLRIGCHKRGENALRDGHGVGQL